MSKYQTSWVQHERSLDEFFCEFMTSGGVCSHPRNTTRDCYKAVCPLEDPEPAADLDAVEQWMHNYSGYPYQEGGDESMEPPEPDAPF